MIKLIPVPRMRDFFYILLLWNLFQMLAQPYVFMI